jgi:hypothetical protein
VRLALRGRRNLDGGVEEIDDDRSRRALALRGRRISVHSLALAAALTALATALPL